MDLFYYLKNTTMNFYQDHFSKIKNIDLLILSEYDLDEQVLHYFNTKQCIQFHDGKEIIIEKPKAERRYFNLFTYDDIQKTPITKEEYDKDPSQNILISITGGNFSTLNYEELIPKFQVQNCNEYFYPRIHENLFWETLNSINDILLNEIKNQDIFFNNFLTLLKFSNNFLRKFFNKLEELEKLEKYKNPIQKLFAENFISFNESLYYHLKDKFNNVTDIFKKIDEQDFYFKKENKESNINTFEITIFKNEKAEKWFYEILEEFRVSNGGRGFGAVIAGIFRNNDCKNYILKSNLTQKDYIQYLNKEFDKKMNTTNFSNSDNYERDIENQIKDYIKSLSE